MKKLIAIFALALVFFSGLSPAGAQEKPVRIAIIGDSTVCNYPEDSVIRGWGQFIQPVFKDNVQVVNLAKSGRSTKTFIKEGLWEKTLQQKPQFILIQFGHNDSHAKEKPEATDAATDFPENLRRYVDESRKAGAVPVFVTPMHRRTFDQSGKLTMELLPYADAMKRVAKEKNVSLVDLHATSGELFQKLGDAASADLSCKETDRTHFSSKGAKTMAELVVKGLREAEPKLKEYWK